MASWSDLIPALVPPRDFSDPAQTYKWSMSVSVTLLLLGGITIVNTALMWGLTPIIFTGFATVADVSQIKKSTDDGFARIEQAIKQQGAEQKKQSDTLTVTFLSGRLFMYRRDQCAAIKRHDNIASTALGDQIDSAKREYLALTGQPYDVRPCDEF